MRMKQIHINSQWNWSSKSTIFMKIRQVMFSVQLLFNLYEIWKSNPYKWNLKTNKTLNIQTNMKFTNYIQHCWEMIRPGAEENSKHGLEKDVKASKNLNQEAHGCYLLHELSIAGFHAWLKIQVKYTLKPMQQKWLFQLQDKTSQKIYIPYLPLLALWPNTMVIKQKK